VDADTRYLIEAVVKGIDLMGYRFNIKKPQRVGKKLRITSGQAIRVRNYKGNLQLHTSNYLKGRITKKFQGKTYISCEVDGDYFTLELAETIKSLLMFAEDKMYEPVANYLQDTFTQFGECAIEDVSRMIPENVKAWLDDSAVYYIRVEKQLPDLIGRFDPDSSKRPPYGFSNGLIVAEIKDDKPTIKAIYQTKLYTEVFEATYAFLICSKAMIEEMRRFLSTRSYLLSYGGAYRHIYIGNFDVDRDAIVEETWYPENPFKQ